MDHKLTVTIITLNEERNIGRCIESLLVVADEVIVLDAYSTDNTLKICKEKNIRFEQREWQGYAASKNYLNSLASHNYIFSVDADEAPDPALIQEILKIKRQGLKGVYAVNRLTNYCGSWIKHSGWYPDIKTRIFPKDKSRWDGEYVHEELVVEGNPSPKVLSGHLLHYSYYDFQEHQERADKYSRLTARKMNARGKKASFFKPYLSALGRFIAMFIVNKGFLDGKMGWHIARISAKSNLLKYKELRRLNHEARK